MSHLALPAAGPLHHVAVKSVAVRGLRLAVLVWLVLSQFPMPVVHSHETLRDSSLISHLARHHQISDPISPLDSPSLSDRASQDLHWHLFLPSDFLARCADEMNGPHSASFSPLGLWGDDGDSVVDLDSASVWSSLHADAMSHWVAVRNPGVVVPPASETLPSHSFTQTYLNVPLCTLVCVMRT
ncbi:hypothetical protein [Novipirellula sp.]|uniref:hypothetical protein n=1 Tax=Novipirellula sp. TaxID=2795430 RepID=UPI003564EA34